MRLLAVFFFAAALIGADSSRELMYNGVFFGNDPLPKFDKGYLLFLKTPPNSCRITVYDAAGTLAFSGPIPNPKSDLCSAAGPAVDTDGTVAVSIAFQHSLGHGAGIVLLDRAGKLIRFIDTGRYVPSDLCFDQEHTIWSIGWQRDAVRNSYPDEKDYGIVRRFSLNGAAIGEFIQRSLWPEKGEPGSTGRGLWNMKAAKDQVGALIFHGYSGRTPEWIEWNLKGELLTRAPLKGDLHGGMAYTEGGRLYAQLVDNDQRKLAVLDAKSREWVPMAGATAGRLLLGAQGDDLVYQATGGGPVRLIWFRPEK